MCDQTNDGHDRHNVFAISILAIHVGWLWDPHTGHDP